MKARFVHATADAEEHMQAANIATITETTVDELILTLLTIN